MPGPASDGSSGLATGSETAAVPGTAADTTGETAAETTAAPPPGCGNGIVEDAETCDDGDDDPCNGCDACALRTYLVLDGGAGHYVEIGDVAGAPLALVGTALTVEAWMRIDDATELVEVSRRGAGNVGWRLSLEPDLVIATVYGRFDHMVPGVAPPGSGWHHVAWTYDLSTSRLFLDGAEIGSMAASDPVASTPAPLVIGALRSGTGEIFDYAAGRIDELRVSNAVRYDGAFTPVRRHAPDATTVLLLHLDEGTGAAVIDASAHGHPGAALGLTWSPDDGYGGCV